jgi:hypothetical protein
MCLICFRLIWKCAFYIEISVSFNLGIIIELSVYRFFHNGILIFNLDKIT